MIPNVTFAEDNIARCHPLDNNLEELEWLGMAAKAIGFELFVNFAGATMLRKDGHFVRFWKPLASNADAFELMVALRITIEFDGSYAHTDETTTELPADGEPPAHGVDAEQRVRLLIVLTAAAMGRKLS